jgi:hypothetical protein
MQKIDQMAKFRIILSHCPLRSIGMHCMAQTGAHCHSSRALAEKASADRLGPQESSQSQIGSLLRVSYAILRLSMVIFGFTKRNSL